VVPHVLDAVVRNLLAVLKKSLVVVQFLPLLPLKAPPTRSLDAI
jgi:hypothetical protein